MRKKLTLLLCVAAGLISTTTIAETILSETDGSTGKAIDSITEADVGVGAGFGADTFTFKEDKWERTNHINPFNLPDLQFAQTKSTQGIQGSKESDSTSDAGSKKSDVFTNPDEAARQSSNPLGGDFVILLNQWNIDFLQGDATTETRNNYTHVIQPVVPISLGGDWIWVTRPTLPLLYGANLPEGPNPAVPGTATFGNESGMADLITFSLVGTSTAVDYGSFLGKGDRVLAAGITSMFPTGEKAFTGNQYSLGPAAVAAFIGEKYIIGALAQHWWDVASSKSDAEDVNYTNLQYFYFMNFPGGWQIGGAPQIEVDWRADSGDKWAVPIGLGVQKTHFFPGIPMPIKLGVELQYYVVDRDTYGNNWRVQFTFAPILPNFISGLLDKISK